MRIGKIIKEIGEAVYPSGIYCISCGSLIDRSRQYSLCDSCMTRMHWITGTGGQKLCGRCGKAMLDTYRGGLCYDCLTARHWFTRGFSCMTYGMYERQLMMDIKYNGKGYMAVAMGDVLFDRMYGQLDLLSDGSGGLLIDLIIPVPVSAGRRKKRGYNQAGLMAGQFRKRWIEEIRDESELTNGLIAAPPCDEHILIRARETRMLRSLNPAERILAMSGAFAVKSGSENRIKNKSILLIDDIYTTGATCDACSRALLEGGAACVYLLTLCSGGNRKPGDLAAEPDDDWI